METIDFSYNWNNKLAGRFFTTLRLNNPKFQVGKTFQVRLKGKDLCIAQVADFKQLRLDDINSYIAGLDTGYTVPVCKEVIRKMYPTKNWKTQLLVLVLFQVITKKDAQLFELKKIDDLGNGDGVIPEQHE